MLDGMQQISTRLRIFSSHHISHRALRHHTPATHARTRANVDHVVGAANGVFVVLHHHQRVALVAELLQGIEQDVVVARVQADGGLVEYVTHALQVATQLRGEANTLSFAATERGRTPVEGEVA